MLLWESWDQAAEEICSDGMGVGCAGSQGCTLGPWAVCCEGGQHWKPVALCVWLPEWHLSGQTGKFPKEAVGSRGCGQTSWWQLGSTTDFMGLLETFDSKACCKIAKTVMERAALELLTQPMRAEQGHSATWSFRGCSEVLCWEDSAMPKSMQVCTVETLQ